MDIPPTRYAHNGDVALAYQVFGAGPADLLVVPGFVWNVEAFWTLPQGREWLERLASFARVVMFDKRGQGLSDRTGEVYTLEQVVDDACVVLDAAGSDQAAVLGLSEGGTQAALLAATRPERVSHLVLWGAYARMIGGPDFPQGIPPERLDEITQRLVAEWGGPALVELFAPSKADDPEFREWWSAFLRSSASPRDVRSLFATYRTIDLRAVLPVVSAPTLVLHRRGDRAGPLALALPFVELIPGARLVELEGDDHVMPLGDMETPVAEIEEFVTGHRGTVQPRRVLATILFTDIADSTALATELGDARWRELLDEHDRLARREVQRHRGRVVKHLGDGMLATFDGPARGIHAACAIRDGVRRLGVEVRAGLHTGECELVGDDVAGVAVHVGARVGALAEPGEVLVSGTVRDLVLGSGLAFAERGAHELKGVPGRWQLAAVRS